MWKDLSLREKRELMKIYVANGVTNRSDIVRDYDSNVANFANSPANFVQRLRDNDGRYIVSNEGDPMTHRMSYVTEDNGAVMFPEVQDNNGALEVGDYNSAVNRRDTVHTSIPFAQYYSEHYKRDYPQFFSRFNDFSVNATNEN